MADLAKRYSHDRGSAKNGGFYGNIAKGMMEQEFEDVAFKLKVGEISTVFETKYGYHFVQLVARNGNLIDVKHILITPRED